LVQVFDGEARATLLAESPQLEQSRWTPEVALPASIFWEVRAYEQNGAEAGPWASAVARQR
jgi:hypothetical protein